MTAIEIEVIPTKSQKGRFINIINKEQESYFHIYFNDGKKEEKRFYLKEADDITNIKIIIDPEIVSFRGLFQFCSCIESIILKNLTELILVI